MKIQEIMDPSGKPVTQLPPILYHVTERDNLGSIQEDGLAPTKQGKRGVNYSTPSVYFMTSLDQDLVEETVALVLYGGRDIEEWDDRSVSLVILKLVVEDLQEIDDEMELTRYWYQDTGTSGGVYTTRFVPGAVLTVEKYIDDTEEIFK